MCTFLATQRLFFQTGNCLLCTGRGNSSLRSSIHCFVEDVFLHVTRFQPFSKNGPVHWCMGQKPFVTDFVETTFDVTLEDPLRACVSQCVVALSHRICTGPALTEPIRVFVSGGFHNWIECEQVQCLLGSIHHCGDSEWSHLFAVRFRDVDTSKGQRSITPLLQLVYCFGLLLRRVPDFSVHAGRSFTSVFRHSTNGEYFAAIRVGQQPLQGSHLAPPAFLRGLHDTHLQSAHVAICGWPVNGIPLRRLA